MMGWRHPLDKFKITSRFKAIDPAHPKPPGHLGTDYAAPEGTPLKAINDGKVVLNEWSEGMGWCLTIHTDGKNFWGYAHMKEQSPIKVGASVKEGDVVGKVGNTGKYSQGAHLHFVLSRSPKAPYGLGKLFDAYDFIEKRKAK